MKQEPYEAPMAVVLNFENDYVMAATGPSKITNDDMSISGGGPTI